MYLIAGYRETIKVGDIAPRENIPKEEKRRLEAVGYGGFHLGVKLNTFQEAMHNFVREMLHDSPAARRIEALWEVRSSIF